MTQEEIIYQYYLKSTTKRKHQPNGKDAESCRKILNINYEKTT